MILSENKIKGSFLIENDLHSDDRGFFKEIYRKNEVIKTLPFENFVQENHSRSKKNVLRGMHYQNKRPQGQLITVFNGKVFYAIVDLRPDSLTFLKTFDIILSSETKLNQIYTPPGVAGGYLALSDWVDLNYKVTEYYDHLDERGINCFDPNLNIKWPSSKFIINSRDENYCNSSDIKEKDFPNKKFKFI